MFSKKELEEAVVRIKKESTADNIANSTTRYDPYGHNDANSKEKLTDKEAAAIKIVSGNNVIYKVKAMRGGSFYNPLKEGSRDYGLNKRDKTTGNDLFTYKQVNKPAFEHYIKFLETKYDSYLVTAERQS